MDTQSQDTDRFRNFDENGSVDHYNADNIYIVNNAPHGNHNYGMRVLSPVDTLDSNMQRFLSRDSSNNPHQQLTISQSLNDADLNQHVYLDDLITPSLYAANSNDTFNYQKLQNNNYNASNNNLNNFLQSYSNSVSLKVPNFNPNQLSTSTRSSISSDAVSPENESDNVNLSNYSFQPQAFSGDTQYLNTKSNRYPSISTANTYYNRPSSFSSSFRESISSVSSSSRNPMQNNNDPILSPTSIDKTSNLTKSLSRLSKEEKLRRKKDFHNAVERRRRDLIKKKIEELTNLVPPSLLNFDSNGKAIKPNKSTILHDTVDYIVILQRILERQKSQTFVLYEKLQYLQNLKIKNKNNNNNINNNNNSNNNSNFNDMNNNNNQFHNISSLASQETIKLEPTKSALFDVEEGKIIDTRLRNIPPSFLKNSNIFSPSIKVKTEDLESIDNVDPSFIINQDKVNFFNMEHSAELEKLLNQDFDLLHQFEDSNNFDGMMSFGSVDPLDDNNNKLNNQSIYLNDDNNISYLFNETLNGDKNNNYDNTLNKNDLDMNNNRVPDFKNINH